MELDVSVLAEIQRLSDISQRAFTAVETLIAGGAGLTSQDFDERFHELDSAAQAASLAYKEYVDSVREKLGRLTF